MNKFKKGDLVRVTKERLSRIKTVRLDHRQDGIIMGFDPYGYVLVGQLGDIVHWLPESLEFCRHTQPCACINCQ